MKEWMKNKIEELLAKEFYCSPKELNENSLTFDENGSTAAKAVYVARDHGQIVAVAGASESSVTGVWEIGVDVMEKCRNARLGTYLVKFGTILDGSSIYNHLVEGLLSQM